jgi:tetratricopeptide (TPR) repeat protein
MKKQILLFCIIISLVVGCQDEYEKFEDLGDSKTENKDYEGAIIEYTKAIKSNPEIAFLYNKRGIAKAYKLDFQGAIDDHSKALDVADRSRYSQYDNQKASFYYNRGTAKFYIDDYANAVKDFTESIRYNAAAETYEARAMCKEVLTDYQGAIDDYTISIDENWKNPASYFHRGEIYHKLNQKDKACSDWSKAGELGKVEAYDKIKEFCNK